MIKGIYEDLGNLGETEISYISGKYFRDGDRLSEEEIIKIENAVTIYSYLAIVSNHKWYRFNFEKFLRKGNYYPREVRELAKILWEQERWEDLRNLGEIIIKDPLFLFCLHETKIELKNIIDEYLWEK